VENSAPLAPSRYAPDVQFTTQSYPLLLRVNNRIDRVILYQIDVSLDFMSNNSVELNVGWRGKTIDIYVRWRLRLTGNTNIYFR